MLTLVDDTLLYMLLGLAAIFFATSGALFILLMRAPSQVRTIMSAWLFKKVLTIEGTLDRGYIFHARKRGPEGTLECKIDGKKSVKIIATNPDPSLAAPAHLDGSGVKAYLGWEPITVVVNPAMAAAASVVGHSEPEKLPESVKEWASHVNIGEYKLLELAKHTKADIPMERKGQTFFVTKLEYLQHAFAGAYRESQYRNEMRKTELDAKEGRGLGGMKLLLIGIIIVIVVLLAAYAATSMGILK